jgi:coproporphyrinogen III oxidase
MEDSIMDMKQYYGELENQALENFKRLNNTNQVEHREYDTPVGMWEVKVVRGEVLEKAVLGSAQITTKHPDTGEVTRFDILQAHVYPSSPKVPILIFSVENFVGKEDTFSGLLDIAHPVPNEEDQRFFVDEIKKVAEKHGDDYEALRKNLETTRYMYKLDQWEKAANAGIGISLRLPKEKFDLIKDAGPAWLKSYFTIVEKRGQESYDREDVALMNISRAKILEFYLIGDRSIIMSMKLGIPLEAITLSLLAPTIRY